MKRWIDVPETVVFMSVCVCVWGGGGGGEWAVTFKYSAIVSYNGQL